MTAPQNPTALSASADGWAPLDELGVLAVRGVDALRFLQGYATCDMDELDGGRILRGAFCNQKGRMLTSFRALRERPETGPATTATTCVLLVMHADLVAATQEMLARYSVFSKAALERPSLRCFGIMGQTCAAAAAQVLSVPEPEPGAVSGEAPRLARLDPQRTLVVAAAASADAVAQRLSAAGLPRVAESRWTAYAVAAGAADVLPGTSLAHTPQALNLPATDGVSFSKGCYLGQEIVARLQYLGQSKTRLFRLGSDVADPAAGATTPVHDAAGRRVGETASPVVPGLSRAAEVLAVLRTDAQAPFRLGEPSADAAAGGWEALPLPYAIPSGENDG